MKTNELRNIVKLIMNEHGLMLASGETIAEKAHGNIKDYISKNVCWACLQNDFLSLQLNED